MFGWKEVYLGTNRDEFFQKQNILHKQQIKFKTKRDNDSIRMAMNNVGGRSAVLSRFGTSEKDRFQIFVKSKDAQYAKELLSGRLGS